MRALFLIISTSLTQAFRRKFLAGLILACLLLLLFTLALSQMSLDDKGRITVNFGLAGIQLLLLALSLVFGSGFIAADLDQKNIWMVLAKSVRPSLFFFGRYLSLAALLFLANVIFSLLLISFFLFLDIPVQTVLFYSLFGFFLESSLILAFVLFFAGFVSSYLVIFYCLSFFIISHFLDQALYFIEKSSGPANSIFSNMIYLIPNLEALNWKSEVINQDTVAFMDFASSSLYIILWTGFILSLSLIFMEKREF